MSNIQWYTLNCIYFVILQPLSCLTREKEYLYLHKLELIDSDFKKHINLQMKTLALRRGN